MSDDLRVLAERGELVLRLRSGQVAARLVAPPALSVMAANDRPPEAVAWGERFFSLTPDGQYVEGLLYVLLTPRVIGGE